MLLSLTLTPHALSRSRVDLSCSLALSLSLSLLAEAGHAGVLGLRIGAGVAAQTKHGVRSVARATAGASHAPPLPTSRRCVLSVWQPRTVSLTVSPSPCLPQAVTVLRQAAEALPAPAVATAEQVRVAIPLLSDAKFANRNVKGVARGDSKWSLNDGQIPKCEQAEAGASAPAWARAPALARQRTSGALAR
jgi:hypothetical protein